VPQHVARSFAAGQKAGIAGHLPDFAEYPLRRIQNREVHIGTRIEDANLQWGEIVGLSQEGGDVLFLSCIQRAALAAASRGDNLRLQDFQFLATPPPGDHGIAFCRKAFGDSGADIIAGTDDGSRGIPDHHVLPGRSYQSYT
jgi:hypothetical protein